MYLPFPKGMTPASVGGLRETACYAFVNNLCEIIHSDSFTGGWSFFGVVSRKAYWPAHRMSTV